MVERPEDVGGPVAQARHLDWCIKIKPGKRKKTIAGNIVSGVSDKIR
jgi:hypothetical protein